MEAIHLNPWSNFAGPDSPENYLQQLQIIWF